MSRPREGWWEVPQLDEPGSSCWRGMRSRPARLLGIGLVSLALAVALGSSTVAGSPDPVAGGASPVMPVSSQAPAASVAPDDRHADPMLEARLPEVLGGVALVRESQLGSQLTRQSDAFDAFLDAVGGSRDGFSLASAYSPGGDLRAQVGAWRVRGADTARLREAFVAALQASSATPLDVEDLTLASVDVTRIGGAGQLAQGPVYAWVDGDTILFVQTPEPALADEAMTKLRMTGSQDASPSPSPSARLGAASARLRDR